MDHTGHTSAVDTSVSTYFLDESLFDKWVKHAVTLLLLAESQPFVFLEFSLFKCVLIWDT